MTVTGGMLRHHQHDLQRLDRHFIGACLCLRRSGSRGIAPQSNHPPVEKPVTQSTTHSKHPATTPSRRQSSVATSTDAAARIISETAHDLRSPITAVRESIRLVYDGELGEINRDQQTLLADAIGQCDCMDQMVGDMVQLDRLRNGLPRVRRRWVKIDEIRQSIDETLRPWALPRRIRVVWDAKFDDTPQVFCDPMALRRLVVNLVTNAIRVTPDGGRVLVELRRSRSGEAIQWRVIDRGIGITEAEMRHLADNQASNSGGEGLGLMICRQLAALHASKLKIRSRVSVGTEVSFETASGGPGAVASCWSRWRSTFRRTPQQVRSRTTNPDQRLEGPRIDPAQIARIQHPVTAELTDCRHTPRSETMMTVGMVTLGAAMSREATDQFDAALQHQLQMFDLAYRIDLRHWVWVLDADSTSVQMRIEGIDAAIAQQMPNVRASWGHPKTLAIGTSRSVAQLTDLLVRQSLSASALSNVVDADSVRLGTSPIEASKVPANRLEAEAKRLASVWRGQASVMRQHAQRLRPVT